MGDLPDRRRRGGDRGCGPEAPAAHEERRVIASSSSEGRQEAAEAWLARHRGRVTGALVLAAAFVRLMLVLQIAAGPVPRIHAVVTESDNFFFDVWGRHIARGDWLQAGPLHPTFEWMRVVADEAVAERPALAPEGLPAGGTPARAALQERLWDGWLHGPAFYQEPIYPYLVGLTYWLTGPDVWHVFAWQLLLGVLGVVLVHRLARRLFCERAALAAGVLAVLAPVPLYLEVTLLRDALVAYATLGLALAMHWAPEGRRSRWLWLGIAFGAASLVKQTFLIFPLAMGAWRLATVRTPRRDRWAAAGLVAMGMGVALLPAIIRNLAVGAPALTMNGSGASMLALFHTASANPFDVMVGSEYPRILASTNGSFVASLMESIQSHPSALGWVRLNAEKLLYAWHGFESPNNVDLYLFRHAAPVLRALPVTFVVIVPLAAVGLATRRAREAWPILVAVAASLPTLALAIVLSRYRAPIALVLLPLAGAGVVRLGGWIGARRVRPLAIAAAASCAYVTWASTAPPGKEPVARAVRYASDGVRILANGEPAFAALYFAESLRLRPDRPKVEALLGEALLAAREPSAALPHLEAASRALDTGAAHELHALALVATGRREEAIAQARAALASEPARASARALLEHLLGSGGDEASTMHGAAPR
ncbi:glycosyltransferase family 39 protein [Anaeromyxobacter sp. Red801]|uniref:glycosyltransferase family 39 protein n=1 Tax=Anaeromyxobacter sp. Red801 TaxID=3411632 RepID=UPI003BA2C3FD